MKFYGNEHTGYKDVNIGEIVESVPEYDSRKLPSQGLTFQQMAEIFREHGISPLIVKKEKGQEERFYQELLCYIESGIPVIAAIDKKSHVVAVIGHGEPDYSYLDTQHGLIAFCGAQRTPMRFRADAVRSITDALKRLL